ncbi:TRAP transporter substrate-binding protein [Cytobacillus sp. S13-E01]|uniref:TRAP transporter substrate-binding protein n=1 Tax=Cytobacillus sp. S13-E01 TaxID=3031326 RepID=UPI0023D7F73F|nr:TRAP transporter substrate-binding protein [Cytobacillus sp. S13-E01]MDF0725956.1 TRAP transporter substrate-binding protein [Cytobacillus sp. S13-E01]
MISKNVRGFKLILALMFALIFVLAGCGGQSTTQETTTDNTPQDTSENKPAEEEKKEKIVLKFGELNPDTHIVTMSIREFGRILDEKTDGRITVEVFPSGQLGDQQTMIQSLQMGALDLYRTNPSYLADLGMAKMNVLHLPFLFRDTDHAWNVIDSDIGQEFLDVINDSDRKMIGLGYLAESPRNFFFRDKVVTKVEDMKGLKIRVPPSQMYLDIVEAFGASPTPIAYSELYSALQTGVVDGAENPIVGYYTNNFQEVAPNYTLNGHEFAPSVVIVSELTWNTLDAVDQQLLKDAMKETEKYMRQLAKEKDEEALVALKAAGVTISELEDHEKWVEMVKPLYEKYGADYLDLIDKIQQTQ